MSELHTRGRVTFKEDGDANHYSMLTEDGRWWLAVLCNGEQTSARQIANFRRLAACWNACQDIPTEKLEGRTIAEYVSDEAYLQGMQPVGDGMSINLSGIACQVLAASFAGQFVGSQAVNYLEVHMGHPETGEFNVTIQRKEGKTPGQMKAEVEQQRDQLLAALERIINACDECETDDDKSIVDLFTEEMEADARAAIAAVKGAK